MHDKLLKWRRCVKSTIHSIPQHAQLFNSFPDYTLAICCIHTVCLATVQATRGAFTVDFIQVFNCEVFLMFNYHIMILIFTLTGLISLVLL